MENLRMPASYATLPEEELPEIFGGGELGDALDSFTDNLHLDDFFFQGGILSISISFVPLLLFNVVVSGRDHAFCRLHHRSGDILRGAEVHQKHLGRQERQGVSENIHLDIRRTDFLALSGGDGGISESAPKLNKKVSCSFEQLTFFIRSDFPSGKGLRQNIWGGRW